MNVKRQSPEYATLNLSFLVFGLSFSWWIPSQKRDIRTPGVLHNAVGWHQSVLVFLMVFSGRTNEHQKDSMYSPMSKRQTVQRAWNPFSSRDVPQDAGSEDDARLHSVCWCQIDWCVGIGHWLAVLPLLSPAKSFGYARNVNCRKNKLDICSKSALDKTAWITKCLSIKTSALMSGELQF